MRLCTLVLSVAFGGLCFGQQQPQQQQQDSLLTWMDRKAQVLLDERERTIAGIRDKATADLRKITVRKKMMDLIGGLPAYEGPLNARLLGRIDTGSYAIEKLIFQSLPGFYVTANIYRPLPENRTALPAVLVPSGHTQEGKPEPQVLAANLALKGFIAMTYDPIGQGEREQTYLPELGRALSGGGGNEHLELGARSLLIGQSVARYFIWDAKRAVDYLITRPDVDKQRIGVTGCSGGGAITTYAAAFDPRIKVAAPGCFINSFRMLFTGQTADSEMSFPKFLASGLDMADFFELAAPMPMLMMATTEDYFTPAGAKPVFEEAKRWYKLYDAEDRLQFSVEKGPHGTPKESREEIYRWMIRWLKDGKGDPSEQQVPIYTNRQLRVTVSGNVQDEPGSRKLYQIIYEEYQKKKQPRPATELIAELRRMGVPSAGKSPSVTNLGSDVIRFESEPGVSIQGKLYLPPGASSVSSRRPAVIVVEEKRLPVPLYVQRSQSTTALAEALSQAGQIVLELEPRDAPSGIDGRPFLGNWVTNERADLIGLNLATMRAHDILAAVDVLAARPDVDPAMIRGYARGAKGFWLMLAAAVDPRLKRIWLDRTPHRFELALQQGPLSSFLFDVMIPGFPLHWDLPQLREFFGGEKRVMWTDPTNWMNQPVFPNEHGFLFRHVGEGDLPYIRKFLLTDGAPAQ
jgi:dienelactone hydrolase